MLPKTNDPGIDTHFLLIGFVKNNDKGKVPTAPILSITAAHNSKADWSAKTNISYSIDSTIY